MREALKRASKTLDRISEPLGRYCRYLLYRGRVAEAAGLLNEVHTLAYAVAKLADSIDGRGKQRPPEVEEAVRELLDASRKELECKVLEPSGLLKAREQEKEALESLREALEKHGEKDKAEVVEGYLESIKRRDHVWAGPQDVGELLSKVLETRGIPFGKRLQRVLDGVIRDEAVEELIEVTGVRHDNPAKVAEDPPVRRIRNKLMHSDPVMKEPEEHADLAELLLVHLEEITLKVLEVWAEAIEGKAESVR